MQIHEKEKVKGKYMQGKDDKMRNAKVCRMQLQLHGFTVCKVMSAAAAPATSKEEKSKESE